MRGLTRWVGTEVVEGGLAFTDLEDMWVYSERSSTWTDITAHTSGSVPGARQCEMDSVGGLLYVFGGWSGGTQTQWLNLSKLSCMSLESGASRIVSDARPMTWVQICLTLAL
eukprot:3936786-Rhodomonas_salina.2